MFPNNCWEMDLRDSNLDEKEPIQDCWLRNTSSEEGMEEEKSLAPVYEIIAQRTEFLIRIIPDNLWIEPGKDEDGNLIFCAYVFKINPELSRITIYGYRVKQILVKVEKDNNYKNVQECETEET